MKQYKVFENSLGTIEIVKQGWSWPAFFFGFIWAFTKKMYGFGAILLLAFPMITAIIRMGGGMSPAVALLMFLLSCVTISVVASIANNLVEKTLLKRGFIFKGVFSASTPEFAMQLYKQHVAAGQGLLTDIDHKLLARDQKLSAITENVEFLLFLQSHESILRAIIQHYQSAQQASTRSEENDQHSIQDVSRASDNQLTVNDDVQLVNSSMQGIPQHATIAQSSSPSSNSEQTSSEIVQAEAEIRISQEEISTEAIRAEKEQSISQKSPVIEESSAISKPAISEPVQTSLTPQSETKPVQEQTIEISSQHGKVTIFCPHCQQRYSNVPPEFIGRSGTCKRCQKKFVATLPNNVESSKSHTSLKEAIPQMKANTTPQIAKRKYVICHHCKEENPAHEKFCVKCWTRLR